jgi:hypothetical protein
MGTAIIHAAAVRKFRRADVWRPFFSLAAELAALIRSLKSAETN